MVSLAESAILLMAARSAGCARIATREWTTTGVPSSAAYSVGVRRLKEGGIGNSRARGSRASTSMSAD